MLYVFREWSFIKDRRTEYFLSLLLALFVSYADTRQFCQEHEHGKHFNIFAPLIITIIFQGTGREKTEMNCYVVYDLTHECCFVRCMLLKITALYLCQVSGKSGGKGGEIWESEGWEAVGVRQYEGRTCEVFKRNLT